MTTHTRTVPSTDLAGAAWFKSSYSDGAGQNCVEIADQTHTSCGAIAIRDSKTPNGPALLVAPRQFAALIAHLCDKHVSV
jgi:hypothetical protein